jgi:CHAD domain-containing protein
MIELDLPDAALPRLLRHPALRGAARERAQPCRLVWHDTSDGALAERGQALAERRGRRPVWSLAQAMAPSDAFAWPGQPAPAMLEALAAADLAPDCAPALVPLVAFEGRRTVLGLPDAVVTIWRGQLRAVAADSPVCRVVIAAEPARAAFALADALLADLPLTLASPLAETGRAMARGGTPRPARTGAPRLPEGLTAERALAFAVGHLGCVLLHWAPAAAEGATPEGVHQSRVAVRRLRSVLRAFRGVAADQVAGSLDAGLKALAAQLGPARDWDVFLSGIGAAMAEALPAEARVAALLADGRAARKTAYAGLRRGLQAPEFQRLLLALAALAADLAEAPAAPPSAEEHLVRVLEKRWKRMRTAADGMDVQSLAALHELRLLGKRMRYVAEIAAPLFPSKPARRFLSRLAELQEALGTLNDAAVAGGLVATLPARGADRAWAQGCVAGFALGRAGDLRRPAKTAWERLAEREPFWR